MEQPVQNGEEDRPLGGGEGHQPERNHRRGQARRLAPNFRWVIPNRQVNDGSGGEGDDMEIFMEEMREIRRKLRELQLRNCLLAQVILLPWGLNSKRTRLLMEEARD